MLCSANRFPLPGAPSTCLLDTAIVPLPSFVLIVAFGVYYFHFRRQTTPSTLIPIKWLHITYLVLVAAQIAMSVLEIIRLALEQLGVGLLPVNTVALLLVFTVLWRERASRTKAMISILAVYWFFMTLFELIKTVRLHRLETLHPNTANNSRYPSSDQFLDNAVMLVLYALFCGTEIVNFFLSRRQSADWNKQGSSV
ncbi:hypothetical protein FB45DRAFT_887463 [Roridomyces roridus]|uniref:ABC transporter TMD0 domain-containing protein n=1 Tax=Roridomyces roridus TaxID=1738132 RepID=A0AAD7G2D7_9AGAR|nr:hypothetical protein FB45DRAFT_887463 [Roridomyces roridus]